MAYNILLSGTVVHILDKALRVTDPNITYPIGIRIWNVERNTMSYILPHLTEEFSPGHVLINAGKRCVDKERSFWDRVVDLFSRDEEVRHRYQDRLGRKMKSIISLIQTEGVKFEYAHHDDNKTGTGTVYRYSLGPDLIFECKFTQDSMTQEKILYSLMEYATTSSPYKLPHVHIGGINTVLIGNDIMPIEITTKEVQIGDFRSNEYRFFSDGRYLYINNKLGMSNHGDICKMVFDYCMANRLHPFTGETHIFKKLNQESLLISNGNHASDSIPEEHRLVQCVHVIPGNTPKVQIQLTTQNQNIDEITHCLNTYIHCNLLESLSMSVYFNIDNLLAFKRYLLELRSIFPQNTTILCRAAALQAGIDLYTWLIDFYPGKAENTEIIVHLVAELTSAANPDDDVSVQEINQVIKEYETPMSRNDNDAFLRHILESEGVFDDENDKIKFLSYVNDPSIEFTIDDISEEGYTEGSWLPLAVRLKGQTIVSLKLSSRSCTTGEYRGRLIIDALKNFKPDDGISLKEKIIEQYRIASPRRKKINDSSESPL